METDLPYLSPEKDRHGSAAGSVLVIYPSPQTKKREDGHDDHDQSHQVDYAVHASLRYYETRVEPDDFCRVPHAGVFIVPASFGGMIRNGGLQRLLGLPPLCRIRVNPAFVLLCNV